MSANQYFGVFVCVLSVSRGTLDVIGIGTVYLLYSVFGIYILGIFIAKILDLANIQTLK